MLPATMPAAVFTPILVAFGMSMLIVFAPVEFTDLHYTCNKLFKSCNTAEKGVSSSHKVNGVRYILPGDVTMVGECVHASWTIR